MQDNRSIKKQQCGIFIRVQQYVVKRLKKQRKYQQTENIICNKKHVMAPYTLCI